MYPESTRTLQLRMQHHGHYPCEDLIQSENFVALLPLCGHPAFGLAHPHGQDFHQRL
jgi:hypothetical protein